MASLTPAVPEVMSNIDVLPKEERPSTNTGSWWQPAEKHTVFETVSCFAIDSGHSLFDLGSRFFPLRNYLAAHPDSEFLLTNRACPVGGGMIRNVVIVSKRVLPEGDDLVFDRLWSQYKASDAAARDKCIKYMPRLKSAPPCSKGSLMPWLLGSLIYLVGGQRSVKTGERYLNQKHSTGANYVEVDVDLQSSPIARTIASSILSYCSAFTIDEAFVVESNDDDSDTPERLLCQIQFKHVDTAQAAQLLREGDYVDDAQAASSFARTTEGHLDGTQTALLGFFIVLAVRLASPAIAVLAMLSLHPGHPCLKPSHPALVVAVAAQIVSACTGWGAQHLQVVGGLAFVGLLWLKAYQDPPPAEGEFRYQAPPTALTALQVAGVVRALTTADCTGCTRCAICLDPYSQDSTAAATATAAVALKACGHAFHRHCLETWLCRHASCPMCRRKIKGVIKA